MEVRGDSMLVMDQPKHTQLQSLVNKAFTPKAIADLAPRIESMVDELIDGVIHKGEMDVVQDIAAFVCCCSLQATKRRRISSQMPYATLRKTSLCSGK